MNYNRETISNSSFHHYDGYVCYFFLVATKYFDFHPFSIDGGRYCCYYQRMRILFSIRADFPAFYEKIENDKEHRTEKELPKKSEKEREKSLERRMDQD